MKRNFLLILALTWGTIIYGQSVELIPYTSFHWGGKLNYYDGQIRFNSSQNFGIALNLNIPGSRVISLEYMNQPTTMDVRFYDFLGPDSKRYDVNMNWYQIGALQQVDMGQVAPFGGITLGVAHMNARSPEIEDAVKFAMTGQVGLKYFLNDKIGIQMHLRMLVPIQWAGFGFYFGGGGSGTTVNAGSYLIQGDVGGGLIFRLGSSSGTSSPTSNY